MKIQFKGRDSVVLRRLKAGELRPDSFQGATTFEGQTTIEYETSSLWDFSELLCEILGMLHVIGPEAEDEEKANILQSGGCHEETMQVAYLSESSESKESILVRRFLALPFRHQLTIFKNLDILMPKDMGSGDGEMFRKLFHRAFEKGRLVDLWDEVLRHHPDLDEDNPFAASTTGESHHSPQKPTI